MKLLLVLAWTAYAAAKVPARVSTTAAQNIPKLPGVAAAALNGKSNTAAAVPAAPQALPGLEAAARSVQTCGGGCGSLPDLAVTFDGRGARVPAHLEDYLPSKRDPATWTEGVTLHLHSYYSDGTESPEKVVERAHAAGVTELALSDHDTTAGIMRAWKRARELGVRFHPSIEMSARGGVHINAVDIAIDAPEIIAINERMRQKRLAHAASMVRKLNEHPILVGKGVAITLDEVRSRSRHDEGGTIQLPHIARVLVDKGVIARIDDAYDELLTGEVLDNAGGPQDPTVDEVLAAVRAAGGKAFLNHPYTVRGKNQKAKDAAVRAILKKVDGLEVYRPAALDTAEQRKRADAFAGKNLRWMDSFGLLAAPGADFHGDDTNLRHLTAWMPKVLAQKLLDALREANRGALAVLERLSGSSARRPSRPKRKPAGAGR